MNDTNYRLNGVIPYFTAWEILIKLALYLAQTEWGGGLTKNKGDLKWYKWKLFTLEVTCLEHKTVILYASHINNIYFLLHKEEMKKRERTSGAH